MKHKRFYYFREHLKREAKFLSETTKSIY